MSMAIDALSMRSNDRPAMLFDSSTKPTLRSGSAGQSFDALLMEGFRARAAHLGLELPPSSTFDGSAPPTADDLWQQAKLRSIAAGNGPGDAMLKVLADAAAARHERRHRPKDLFSL
jgi:hypothetical protein